MYDLSRKKTKLSFSPSCFLALSDTISISREIILFSHTREGLSPLDHHLTAFSKHGNFFNIFNIIIRIKYGLGFEEKLAH